MTKAEDWGDTLDELSRRRRHAHAMGGTERLAKHHGKGKLDARARLEHLLDKGSFREFGTLVGGDIAADGIVAGSGLIHGSPVMVGAEDFTTLAGSSHAAEDVESKLRKMEVEASFRSASHLGFDDLIDPEETRDALLLALQRGIYSRQAAAEPVSRTVITP